MIKFRLLFTFFSFLLAVSISQATVTVICNGSESGGTGPRDYYYEITLEEGDCMDYFQVGTDCLVLSHYTDIITPDNWTFGLDLNTDELANDFTKTPHGQISPGWNVDDDDVFYFSGISITTPGTYYFGFNNPHRSHDVGGTVENCSCVVWDEDWTEPVGIGKGPIHGPVPEPATMILMGLGGLALLKKRNN